MRKRNGSLNECCGPLASYDLARAFVSACGLHFA